MQLAADKFCALANMTTSSSTGLISPTASTTTTLPVSSDIPGIIGNVAGMGGKSLLSHFQDCLPLVILM